MHILRRSSQLRENVVGRNKCVLDKLMGQHIYREICQCHSMISLVKHIVMRKRFGRTMEQVDLGHPISMDHGSDLLD